MIKFWTFLMSSTVTHAVNAIIVLDVFCSGYSDLQQLAKHNSTVLPCK